LAAQHQKVTGRTISDANLVEAGENVEDGRIFGRLGVAIRGPGDRKAAAGVEDDIGPFPSLAAIVQAVVDGIVVVGSVVGDGGVAMEVPDQRTEGRMQERPA
jgi:hypothetical protein